MVRDRSRSKQTPNLAGIVQEVVDRDGWVAGNALALLFEGSGRRVADAGDKLCGGAPALSVAWTDAVDMDGDGLPDCWERAAAGQASERLQSPRRRR